MQQDLTPEQLWERLQDEARRAVSREPLLADFMQAMILGPEDFGAGLAAVLGRRLGLTDNNAEALTRLYREAFAAEPALLSNAVRDMQASHERDPACRSWLQPFLYFKGIAALQNWRVAHELWKQGRVTLALHLQSLGSQLLQVDIHPAAQFGDGIFIDHATGIVIGETAVVGDDTTILHDVTLGGNGKERGDRHPKIGKGVLLSAGAKVLGNIKVGDGARIAASSVVLEDVPPHTTVAGIPAKPVQTPKCANPAETLEHSFL